LFSQAIAWALPDRSPLAAVLYDTVRYTAKLYAGQTPRGSHIPKWMRSELRSLAAGDVSAKDMVPKRLGIAPHRLENALTWWRILETLPHLTPQLLFRPEYRYPMLDKDLVEYLFSIPPEQIARPGRRRAMMRRALRGVVPYEILERRRKAFQHRAPLRALRDAYPRLQHSFRSLALADMGFVDADLFRTVVKETVDGNVSWYHSILRAIAYELWLRGAGTPKNPTEPLLASVTQQQVWPCLDPAIKSVPSQTTSV
jgi:asparagine synthase (glutamine-hydrolysing)